jgi:hypothetical protein
VNVAKGEDSARCGQRKSTQRNAEERSTNPSLQNQTLDETQRRARRQVGQNVSQEVLACRTVLKPTPKAAGANRTNDRSSCQWGYYQHDRVPEERSYH